MREKEAREWSEQVRSGDGAGRWVRTPGSAGRGSGVPGPLTVIAQQTSRARAGAVSGEGVGLGSGIRCRLPRPSLASEAVVEKGRGQGERTPGRGAGRSARVRRRREAPGALSLFPLRPAGGARRRARGAPVAAQVWSRPWSRPRSRPRTRPRQKCTRSAVIRATSSSL